MPNNIKRYKFFCESLSQEKIDSILDKISEYGYESLTQIEKDLINSFNGDIKSDDSSDVKIDNDGDLSIGGEKLNKRKEVTKWDRNLKDEIEEYLFNNFRRENGLIYDNLELKVDKEEIINRVKRFFNCKLQEVNDFIIDWCKRGLSLRENNKLDFLNTDQKFIDICLELTYAFNELLQIQNRLDGTDLNVLQQFADLFSIYVDTEDELDISEMIPRFKAIDNKTKIVIYKLYNEYKGILKKMPSKEELTDRLLAISDNYTITIFKYYENENIAYHIEIKDLATSQLDDGEFDKFVELVNTIQHIRNILKNEYNGLVISFDQIEGFLKIYNTQ